MIKVKIIIEETDYNSSDNVISEWAKQFDDEWTIRLLALYKYLGVVSWGDFFYLAMIVGVDVIERGMRTEEQSNGGAEQWIRAG